MPPSARPTLARRPPDVPSAVHYRATAALKGVGFHISAGEVVAIVDPNGAGKGSLLAAIAGIVSARGGSIVFAGEPMARSEEPIFRRRRAPTCLCRRQVANQRQRGRSADDTVIDLAPQIRAAHPDWHFPEWIDFAIRYYASLS
jgi:ABC-type cobalamin/Fe3+-siderophores transport system ATPase subunit